MTTQQPPQASPPTAPPPPSAQPDYPVRLEVEFPEKLSRVRTLFRIFLLIPITILVSLAFFSTVGIVMENPDGSIDFSRLQDQDGLITVSVASGIGIATALMLLFRRKYPRWWFDFQQELSRFSTRILIFSLLLRDEYPSTDEKQALTLDYQYPDATRLHRVLPLVKWLLVIPHLIVLAFLGLAVFFITIFAWFAILFTGRYPGQDLFNFVVGVLRWGTRVNAYAFLLVTDRYPPFSLK